MMQLKEQRSNLKCSNQNQIIFSENVHKSGWVEPTNCQRQMLPTRYRKGVGGHFQSYPTIRQAVLDGVYVSLMSHPTNVNSVDTEALAVVNVLFTMIKEKKRRFDLRVISVSRPQQLHQSHPGSQQLFGWQLSSRSPHGFHSPWDGRRLRMWTCLSSYFI